LFYTWNSADASSAHGLSEVTAIMHRRAAHSETEIDFLPPFGEPEVVTTGDAAADVALAGVAGAVALSIFAQS